MLFRQQNTEQKGNKPPLNRRRIVAGILAGLGVIIALGAIGHLLFGGVPIVPVGLLIGIFIGSVVGSPLVVYAIGNRGNETGSLLLTWGGGIVGIIVMVVLLLFVSISRRFFPFFFSPQFFLLFLLFLPSIGATIGFNKTRRYKSGYENEPH